MGIERFKLDGKVAIVVGGRGLVGTRLSHALSEAGATVYGADLPGLSLAAAGAPVATRAPVVSCDVDVTDPDSIAALVKGVLADHGRVDVLVYSATKRPKDFWVPFTEASLDGWRAIQEVEMDGLFLVTREVGRAMEIAKRGSIVLMASIYGMVGNDQRIYEGSNLAAVYSGAKDQFQPVRAHAGYAAAKGAVISLTRYLAAYWGEAGIRVNCVSSGGIEHAGESQNFVDRYAARTPLGRKARLDELDGAVVYLASDAAGYVTGHNLVVDGGWTAW